MSLVNFYSGPKDSFSPETHGGGVYSCTDTKEVFLFGQRVEGNTYSYDLGDIYDWNNGIARFSNNQLSTENLKRFNIAVENDYCIQFYGKNINDYEITILFNTSYTVYNKTVIFTGLYNNPTNNTIGLAGISLTLETGQFSNINYIIIS